MAAPGLWLTPRSEVNMNQINTIPAPVKFDLQNLSLDDSIRLVGVAAWCGINGVKMSAPGWSAVWHERESYVRGSSRGGANCRPSVDGGILAPVGAMLRGVDAAWRFIDSENRRIAAGSRLYRGDHEGTIARIKADVKAWLEACIDLSR